MKYVSLHVAIHHPLIAVNQSLKGTLGSRVCSIPRASGIDLQLKNITGTGEGLVGGHEERDGSLNVQNPAIISIVEKASMLTEAPIRLDTINHNVGLYYDFGVNATIGLCDKGCIRGQQGKVYPDLCHVQDVGASQEAIPLVEFVICSRGNGRAIVDLRLAKRGLEQQAALAN